MAEREKANVVENMAYVSGVGIGAVILHDGLRKAFGRDRSIGERIDGLLRGFVAGSLAVVSGAALVKQTPLSKTANDMITGGLFASALIG